MLLPLVLYGQILFIYVWQNIYTIYVDEKNYLHTLSTNAYVGY